MTGMKKNDERKEAKLPDDTSPVDMEEVVSDRKDDNNEKNDKGKGAEFHDDNSPVEIEEGVKDINDDRN